MKDVSKLSADNWHTKLYRWTEAAWDRWFGYDTDPEDVKRSNICQYIRTLTLKLGFMILAHFAFVAWAIYVLFVFPVTYAGGESYGSFWLTCFFLIGAAFLGFWLLQQGVRVKRYFLPPERPSSLGNKTCSLFEVILQFIQDKHDRICTTIEIKD